jgi:hypothetical protein
MTFSSRPTLNATRARQGRVGRHMIWVLLFGTLLAALGLFAAWTWKSGDLASAERTNAKQPAVAQAFNAPEPAAVVPQPGTDHTAPDGSAPSR